jgi:tetratricopeptide (TPR) repeat protein
MLLQDVWPARVERSLIRHWAALALFACFGCGAQRSVRPIEAPSAPPPVVVAMATPEPEPDCRSDRDSATALSNEGDRVVKVDVDSAIRNYTRAAALYPAEHRILWKLALAYERKEDWPRMIATLTRAVELAPQFAHYWFKLGYAWMSLAEHGDRSAFERAKEPLQRCIAADPNVARCHFSLGEAYWWTNDDHSALIEYSKAIQHDPEVGYFYPPLADIYLSLRLDQQAEGVLSEGTRLVENNWKNKVALYTMHAQLSLLRRFKGDQRGMRRALQQAQEYVDDTHPEFLFALGSTYATLVPPDKERALRLLNQFAKIACPGTGAESKQQCAMVQSFVYKLGRP